MPLHPMSHLVKLVKFGVLIPFLVLWLVLRLNEGFVKIPSINHVGNCKFRHGNENEDKRKRHGQRIRDPQSERGEAIEEPRGLRWLISVHYFWHPDNEVWISVKEIWSWPDPFQWPTHVLMGSTCNKRIKGAAAVTSKGLHCDIGLETEAT